MAEFNKKKNKHADISMLCCEHTGCVTAIYLCVSF